MQVALAAGSVDKGSEVDTAEEGGMRRAAWVEVADSYPDEGEVDMGRPHVEGQGNDEEVEGKHYAADLAIGRAEDREQVLLGRKESIALDGRVRVEGSGCVHLWLEVSAVSAVVAHSMLLGLGPLEGDIVALRVPSAPCLEVLEKVICKSRGVVTRPGSNRG